MKAILFVQKTVGVNCPVYIHTFEEEDIDKDTILQELNTLAEPSLEECDTIKVSYSIAADDGVLFDAGTYYLDAMEDMSLEVVGWVNEAPAIG